jgi:hypothetical protein
VHHQIIDLRSLSFSDVGAHGYKLLLLCPTGSGKLCLHFHLKMKEISSMTHWLIKSVLFNLHEFEWFFFCFPCYCFLISSHYGLLGYRGLFWLFLVFDEVCFMTQDVIYFGESSMGSWEKCVVFCMLEYSITIK